MQISFRMRGNSQQITLSDLNSFESMLGMSLPQDYREHMLAYNGGIVEPMEIRHINYEGNDQGISYFFPIKYGSNIMEEIYTNFNGKIPNGYIVIGVTRGQGRILLSLNNDNTYGKIVEWYPDGEINELSLSFTQLLNDMVESDE